MARDQARPKVRERAAQQAAEDRFRTTPRVLGAAAGGAVRVSVEGQILLHVPAHDPPFQLERCCTQCGSSDPVRWPTRRVQEVAGAPVRVPDGHRCFWCRCQDVTSGRPAPAPAVRRPMPDVGAAAPAPAAPSKPWWRRLYGIPAWAEIGPLRSPG